MYDAAIVAAIEAVTSTIAKLKWKCNETLDMVKKEHDFAQEKIETVLFKIKRHSYDPSKLVFKRAPHPDARQFSILGHGNMD